jgi:hypothetical protein
VDLLEALLEELVDQLRLVGEAPVDGADADPGVMRDVVERDAEAALRKQLAGGVEDLAPIEFGVLAQRAVGDGHGRRLAKVD